MGATWDCRVSFPRLDNAPGGTIRAILFPRLGAIASGAPLMEAGGFDRRETSDLYGASAPGRTLADRDGVISFQTEVLTEAVEVTGSVSARL